jgi:hypothetical protein
MQGSSPLSFPLVNAPLVIGFCVDRQVPVSVPSPTIRLIVAPPLRLVCPSELRREAGSHAIQLILAIVTPSAEAAEDAYSDHGGKACNHSQFVITHLGSPVVWFGGWLVCVWLVRASSQLNGRGNSACDTSIHADPIGRMRGISSRPLFLHRIYCNSSWFSRGCSSIHSNCDARIASITTRMMMVMVEP